MVVPATSPAWISEESVLGLSASLGEPDAVARARRGALSKFRELALEPNPLYRKYGYFAGVDLAGIDPSVRGPPVPAPAPSESSIRILHDASGSRVHVPEAAGAAGVRVEVIPELWSSDAGAAASISEEAADPPDRLSALGLATVNRGYRLSIPDHCPVPVRLRDVTVLSEPHQAISIHRTIRAGRASHLLVTEETFSVRPKEADQQRLHASSVRLDLADDARAGYVSLHAPDPRAVSIYTRRASLGRAARLAWVWAGVGGFRTKLRNRSFLPGAGAMIDDLQAFYGSGDQAYDSAVDITHIGTDTRGNSITRGVFRDNARGMSRGLVRIEKDARKTVSFLSEHAMLLSRGARSDTVPVLEILCRDVKATHSSSVAPVDPEKVFYIESRGFREPEAVRMIGEGFLGHVYDRAPIAGLRDTMHPFLTARWEGRPIEWSASAFPVLPDLDLTGTESAPEWRFDAKLR